MPPLPPARSVRVGGRGRVVVRDAPGPPGAPALVLLHGLTAGAELNWFSSFPALGEEFRTVAVPHRGYGGGLPASGPCDLEGCADDAVATVAALGLERFVAVGYSMGGAVAQLMWRRHHERVSGLVLCATSGSFVGTRRERLLSRCLPAWTSVVGVAPVLGRRFVGATLVERFEGSPWLEWASSELGRAHPAHMLSGASALARFSSVEWLGQVDVPVAVVVTATDALVPARRQRALAAAIPGAQTFEVDADHGAPVTNPEHFVPALVAACRSVTERARRQPVPHSPERRHRGRLHTGFSPTVKGRTCVACGFQGFVWQTRCPNGHPLA